MKTFIRKAIHGLFYGTAFCIILAATAVSITQLLTPYLNDHRAEISAWASKLLNVPITINQVTINWRRAEPEIVLRQVAVFNKQTHTPTFKIQKIKINLKILQSILQRTLLPESIRIDGVHLTLRQKQSGQLHVEGLDKFVFMDNLTGGSVAGNAMCTWVFSQSRLALRNIEIDYIPEMGPKKSITLAALDLYNTKTEHILKGQATLNQAIPTQIAINLQWEGNTFDIMHASSRVHLYLDLDGISLPQWLSAQTWKNLQVKQGTGNGKIWLIYENGQIQSIQSQFQLYAIQLHSLVTKKTVYLPHLSGHLNWRRDGESQLINGEDLLINFSEHVWPITQFSFSWQPSAESTQPPLKRKMGKYALKVSYLDLSDMNKLALASGFLPQALQKIRADLNLRGEVRSLSVLSDGIFQPENINYSAEFTRLSLDSWQSFPGIINASGQITGDEKQGKLTLNSQNTTVTLNSIFAKPLQFNTFSGEIAWQKDAAAGLALTVKNFQVSNSAISASTTASLSFPNNGSSTINLSGEFSVPKVEEIENYLPLKKFEAPFVKWLHGRFQSGQLTSGKVVVQGKLNDFPFANEPGKFLVSAAVKNLQFEYAPAWPMVHEVYGSLVFSGQSMTANVDSAKLLGIPLAKVHAHIPYIGALHPQILQLQTVIKADLAQGLQFIHESPLQDTLGKDLVDLQLSGAMDLKLALIIPINTPEKSNVSGDVTVTDAVLQLPSWNLTLTQLAGLLHFTENSTQITHMQGRLFDEPVSLNMNTIHAPSTPSVVQAVLQSKVSDVILEKWLKLSLSQFIQGSTSYTAELDIVSHQHAQPTQLTIRSNLVGMRINLPENYAKKAEDPRDFQLLLNLKQDQPLQAKLVYGKLLTAAFTYKKSPQDWQFYSGEVRLGNNGQANWQSQSGILITGQTDKLDWNSWRNYFTSLSAKQDNIKALPDTWMNYLRGIDIQANQIPIFGQNLQNAHVQAMPEENNWKIDLASAQMTGQIWLPMPGSKSIIQAKFQHFALLPTKDRASIDPKTIPAFSFVGEEVSYKNNFIGHVALDVAPSTVGLEIQDLSISTDFFGLHAKGQWSSGKNKNQTSLQGTLNTNNVSQLLDHWGLGSANLVAGDGHISFDVNWLNPPYDPALTTLSGEIFIKLGKGRVINLGNSTNAKLGFGRMLNILSLQTLPRRLSLDFTDLFEKGYSFDSMQGHFNLADGNALTKDTYFEGPIARIEIKGRVGLTAKNYDLILSITPYVTGSIPIVATLAGGPIVGALTWVVEKAASSVVSKVTTYHYSITGPWDDPIWAQIKAN